MFTKEKLKTAIPLVLFSILLCVQFHSALSHGGRFMAEEGTIFFEKAWNSTWYEALFFSYGGYLNIAVNAGTLLAYHLMSLENAPYMTMGIGLLFQLLAPWLILSAKDPWLAAYRVRLGAVALLLLVPEWVEVSLHTLHAQYHLALCCGIILGLATQTGWRQQVRNAILFFTPLSGPGGIIMAPLFILRAIVDRTRTRLIECLLINGASAIQVIFFFRSFHERTYNFNFYDYVLVFLTRYVVTPLMPQHHMIQNFGIAIRNKEIAGHPPYLLIGISLLLIALCVGTLIYQYIYNKNAREASWFALAGGTHALASMYGALGGAVIMLPTSWAERYVFVGQSLFALAIICLAVTATPTVKKTCRALVAILLIVGVYHFILVFIHRSPSGASWWEEVARWRQDHNAPLEVWPQSNWLMHL